jgi:hypothetical protein
MYFFFCVVETVRMHCTSAAYIGQQEWASAWAKLRTGTEKKVKKWKKKAEGRNIKLTRRRKFHEKNITFIDIHFYFLASLVATFFIDLCM